jgi:hypothetical protein
MRGLDQLLTLSVAPSLSASPTVYEDSKENTFVVALPLFEELALVLSTDVEESETKLLKGMVLED